MRIDPRIAAAQLAALPKPHEPGRPRFAVDSPAKPPRPGAAASSATLATLDAILALQGEEDPASRRRRSARRGKNLLDGLDQLKASLLTGRVGAADLARITRDLRTGAEPSNDSGLDEVVSAIELRAKVELAKLGRADLA